MEYASDYEIADGVPERTLRALAKVDVMPPHLRECVHEYGYAIVHAMVAQGVTKPESIHYLVKEVWEGARQPTQRTGKKKSGGRARSPVLDKLDWLLIQAGAGISAATLVRVLAGCDLFIVPSEPSPAMVEASMDATNHMGVVSKAQKHRNRLRSALKASMGRFTRSPAPSLSAGESGR